MAQSFLTRAYKKLPFAMPSAEADRQIKDRDQKMAVGLLQNSNEPKKVQPVILQEPDDLLAIKRRIN
jgi:hypothetical protein